MRRIICFGAVGHKLVGTLDLPAEGAAAGTTGVLIVSGGNEPRMGAHRGMAMLAAALAARGVPAFRFDRRGIGDSAGDNGGYATSAPDIASAAQVFAREVPGMTRIVAFGNCDAASALALFGRATGADAVVLANPWLGREADALPPRAAIRARYAGRLRSPAAWRQIARRGVDIRKLAAGLYKLARRAPPDAVATAVLDGIGGWGQDATVVLAVRDGTAQTFAAAVRGRDFRTLTVPTTSHSFADDEATAALLRVLLDVAGVRERWR